MSTEQITSRTLSREETLGVSLRLPKTAALIFDRVWSPGCEESPYSEAFPSGSPLCDFYVPLPIRYINILVVEPFYYASLRRDWRKAISTHRIFGEAMADVDPNVQVVVEDLIIEAKRYGPSLARLVNFPGFLEKTAAQSLTALIGASACTVLDSGTDEDSAYLQGNDSALVTTLSNLPIPVEDALSWEQVMQFRNDKTSRHAFFRFRHWLDAEMTGKPHSFVQDEVALRLQAYEAAIKKHGIRTAKGYLERVISKEAMLAKLAAAGVAQASAGELV